MKDVAARPSQARDLDRLCRHLEAPRASGAGLAAHVHYCTGAGKTVIGLIFAARTRANPGDPEKPGRYTHAIFTGPSDVIARSFQMNGVSSFSDSSGMHEPLDVRGDDEIDLENYLALEHPDFALHTTHQLLTSRLKNLRRCCESHPRFFARKLLFLDEAHHAVPENLIGALPDLWTGTGGDVIFSTATARDAVPAGTFAVIRTLPEQMAERYAPAQILSQAVAVHGAWTTDDEDAAVPVEPDEVASAFAGAWKADGRPKSVVRIKSANHDKNAAVLLSVALAVLRAGGRVYVASPAHEIPQSARGIEIAGINDATLRGAGLETGAGLAELREREARVRRYEDSSVDVIVGIHTIVEGIDFPLTSHAYLLGIPRKLETIVQILGRTTRPRIAQQADGSFRPKVTDYPEDWRDRSKIVFLTAADPEGRIREAETHQMLALCAYLATLRQWSPLGAVWKTLHQLEWTAGPEVAEDAREKIRAVLAPAPDAVEILAAWREAEKFFEECGVRHARRTTGPHVRAPSRRLTVSEKVKLTLIWIERTSHAFAGRDSTSLREAVEQVLILDERAARPRLAELFEAERVAGDEGSSMRRAMTRLVREFEDETASVTFDPFGGDVRLTAEGIEKWGRRVAEIGDGTGLSAPDRYRRAESKPAAHDPYSALFSRRRA